MDASEEKFIAVKQDFVHRLKKDSCGCRKFMKPKNALKTVAKWFFGEHGPVHLYLTKDRSEWTGLQEHQPPRYKMFTAADADFLRGLQITADPADCLQPYEKTLGRQILERFWAEDR